MGFAYEETVNSGSQFIVRNTVLWVGLPPNAALVQHFHERQLNYVAYSKPADLLELLPSAKALIIRHNKLKPGLVRTNILAFCETAANHGVRTYAAIDEMSGFPLVQSLIAGLNLPFTVEPVFLGTAHIVAERIARLTRENVQNRALTIDPSSVQNETHRLLLQRAFAGCSEIKLIPLMGGNSAHVFQANVKYEDGGRRPLPYFVKVDRTRKIKNEVKNYGYLVSQFIPFSHRPNLNFDRILFGAREGILVGNFIENSESLQECVARAAGQQAIHSLFDEVLRGWRLEAHARKPEFGSIFKSMKGSFLASRISRERFELITELGGTITPKAALTALTKLQAVGFRSGPAHRDLHSENVRVKAGAAFLIDFNAARWKAPILADPAALEVSLVFSASSGRKNFSTWTKTVDTLYRAGELVDGERIDHVRKPPPPAKQPDPREALWNAVRLIRMFALADQVSENEYLIVLAIQLFRYSTFTPRSASEARRRAYAYVVGERLLRQVTGTDEAQQ